MKRAVLCSFFLTMHSKNLSMAGTVGGYGGGEKGNYKLFIKSLILALNKKTREKYIKKRENERKTQE